MQIRTLGRTAIPVSLVSLGAAPLADLYTAVSDEQAVATVHAARGVGIMLAGVFNSGILATGARPGAKYDYVDAPVAVLERVRQIEAICARHQVVLATAALQFPLAHPAIDTLVLGMSTPDKVTMNLSALAVPVPHACWQELRQADLIAPTVPLPS